MTEHKNELHKEFELERLILFSDAVFAIAITIIIIEIKFPEIPKNATAVEILEAFKPTLIQFLGFVLSFFFIGMLWMRHLQLFRYLVKYDNGLIKRNLFFLFFVVCFPFSASGITEHVHPDFMLPLIIYMFNIAAVFICQAFLCVYIFRKRPLLSAEGYEKEKNYLVLRSKWFAVALSFVALLYLVSNLFFPFNPWNSEILFFIFSILMVTMRKRIKKYKPVTVEDV